MSRSHTIDRPMVSPGELTKRAGEGLRHMGKAALRRIVSLPQAYERRMTSLLIDDEAAASVLLSHDAKDLPDSVRENLLTVRSNSHNGASSHEQRTHDLD